MSAIRCFQNGCPSCSVWSRTVCLGWTDPLTSIRSASYIVTTIHGLDSSSTHWDVMNTIHWTNGLWRGDPNVCRVFGYDVDIERTRQLYVFSDLKMSEYITSVQYRVDPVAKQSVEVPDASASDVRGTCSFTKDWPYFIP